MLGHRSPQRNLFEAEFWPHRVVEDSIYGRMAAVRDVLFNDDDLAKMYCPDKGRRSLPPSLLCGVLLLQFHDGVGDDEAVERCQHDLRWKVALGLALDFVGFDPTSLVVFRKRLLKHKEERYAFDRFLKVAREAGFLPEKLRQLVDSTSMKGGGAVQNTYTLLRKGIRKLLKAMGFDVPGKRRGLQASLQGYLDNDKKADIDWSDPKARAEQLKVLVKDAEAALDLAAEHADDQEVRMVGWLLTKIMGDDIEAGEDGEQKLGQGVSPDRMISWTYPEMRHERMSSSRRWDGDKVQVAEEPETELITEIEVVDASAGDGASLLSMVQSVEEHLEVKVERATGDTAYGSVDNRVKCAEQGVDLVSPVATPANPDLAKSAFQIDEVVGKATCPKGQTTMVFRKVKDDAGKKVKQFVFERDVCVACQLFERCVKSKTHGRTVTLNYHEDMINEARERQRTEEFKEKYKERPKVERKIAELVHHGLREARYIGRKKKRFQALWTAALVNFKRLFKLFGGDVQKFRAALLAAQRAQMGL